MANLLDLLHFPGFGVAAGAGAAAIFRLAVTIAYAALLAAICLYGLHRYRLVTLYRRHRRRHARPGRRFSGLPRVTIQLPIYNEPAVAERVIDAACAIDYPRDRLQVQVLDDSTDGTADLTLRRARHWAQRGVDIVHLRRPTRAGYKAGALDHALAQAAGELVAVFDADFLPPAGFLRRTVHHFTDPGVGMVQARWSHLNRGDSLLTRAQAIFLDGHFVVEHTARNRSGAWMNFNGTAGIWRRTAIDTAGGWQHDTLTEDVDLSYRAQLAGWRFVYLPHITCPGELPPEMNAFKTQQHRWTKGTLQVAIKLLPRILMARLPRHVKAEAFFHLTGPLVNLFITLLVLLFYPVITLNAGTFGLEGTWAGGALGAAMLGLGIVSALVFYTVAEAAERRPAWWTLLHAPLLVGLGVGVALSNTIACIEALLRRPSEFVRTPKYGGTASNRRGAAAPPGGRRWLAGVELVLAGYLVACTHLALQRGDLLTVPFLLVFAAGYTYVATLTLVPYPSLRPARRPTAAGAPPAAPAIEPPAQPA